jgi:hypothetical protein
MFFYLRALTRVSGGSARGGPRPPRVAVGVACAAALALACAGLGSHRSGHAGIQAHTPVAGDVQP